MSNMSINDPWFWGVDELVVQLCHSPALFTTAARSAADVPDRPALETELRKQNITGKALLTTFDTHAVSVMNKLRLPRPSQRLALLAVIELLQQRSHEYNQRTASTGTEPFVNVAGTPSTIRKPRKIEPHPAELLHQPPQTHHMSENFENLLRWQDTAENDEIVDFAAKDSLGDEEHDDWADDAQVKDDLDLSLDSKEREEIPIRTNLSDEEIVDIINARINFYIDTWKPGACAIPGEEVDYDVDKMWDEAEASGQRQSLVQKHETDYAYYSDRLDTLCDEIMKFPGSTAEQVRQQCRNLQVTVECMELAGWLKDIYKLEPVADSDHELANDSDGVVRHESLPRLQSVADIEIIDLDSLSEPPEPSKCASSLSHSVPDMVCNSGISMDHQTQILTPKPVITDSIEPTMENCNEPQNSIHILANYGDVPENASVSSVRRWKWHDLIEHLDRKRIVSKTVFEMDISDRESVRSRVRLIDKNSLLREIAACVNMLRKQESKLPGILPQDMHKIVSFTNLFLSWWFCTNYLKEPHASVRDLEELKSCIEDGSAEISTFYRYLCIIMETTFSERALQNPEAPSQAEVIEISDDDE